MEPLDITLCLIVKDEERYVEDCIKSVLPFVSKILIADTGSSDNTVSICKRYTNHVEKIDFSSGFSVARNHLLNQVKTKWVLFLDADEYFDPNQLDKLAKIIPDLSDKIDALSLLRYNFFSSGAFYTSETIKLFRSDPTIRYSGVVVDSIKPSLVKKGGEIVSIPIILNHFGHCRPIKSRDEKALKYLKMMDEELQQNPENYKVIGYKALILRTLGKFEEAYQWSESALKAAPNQGHPHFVKGHIERAFGRHEQAVKAYNTAMEFDGMNAAYLNSRGVANLTLGFFDVAEKDFILGQRLYPHHIHFSINQGLIDQARHHYKEAFIRFHQIGQKYPAFLKSDFVACTEVDPYSGFIYDTIYNYRGLSYHMFYCQNKAKMLL